jgi:hypothetical protein
MFGIHRCHAAFFGNHPGDRAGGGTMQQLQRAIEIGLADAVAADKQRQRLDREILASDRTIALDVNRFQHRLKTAGRKATAPDARAILMRLRNLRSSRRD